VATTPGQKQQRDKEILRRRNIGVHPVGMAPTPIRGSGIGNGEKDENPFQQFSLSTFNLRSFVMKRFVQIVVLLAVVGTVLEQADAASILWNTAQTVSADADVATAGTLVKAVSARDSGSGSVSLNGVSFEANTDSTFASAFAYSGGPFEWGGAAESAPIQSLSDSYKGLLWAAWWKDSSGSPESIFPTLTGLTVGHNYLVQFWVDDSRPYGAGRSEIIRAFEDSTGVSLAYNSTGDNGGVGQCVTGTFVADGSTESLVLTSSSSCQLNAFQVRDLTPTPEPSTAVLLGLAAAGLLAYTWRKRKAV
jgi:hypothetical protein